MLLCVQREEYSISNTELSKERQDMNVNDNWMVRMKDRVQINSRYSAGPGCLGLFVSKGKTEQTATVCFRVPNTPHVCEECESPLELSVNGATGEIVCMRTGCGHGHGFSPCEIDVPLSKIE
jgi:hypothetical protein